MKLKLTFSILFLSTIVVQAQDVKPLSGSETINFEFLENNWEVVMVAFGDATISGANLKNTPHYFTMQLGEYGNFFQSNLDYETALDALTEAQEEKQKEGEREEQVKKYTENMLVYAKAWNDARVRHVTDPDHNPMPEQGDIPLPEPIPSVEWHESFLRLFSATRVDSCSLRVHRHRAEAAPSAAVYLPMADARHQLREGGCEVVSQYPDAGTRCRSSRRGPS